MKNLDLLISKLYAELTHFIKQDISHACTKNIIHIYKDKRTPALLLSLNEDINGYYRQNIHTGCVLWKTVVFVCREEDNIINSKRH